MNGRLLSYEDENARFCIDVYRNGSEELISQGATTREVALTEFDRLVESRRYERIELYQWIDYDDEWGEPIEVYEAEDPDVVLPPTSGA